MDTFEASKTTYLDTFEASKQHIWTHRVCIVAGRVEKIAAPYIDPYIDPCKGNPLKTITVLHATDGDLGLNGRLPPSLTLSWAAAKIASDFLATRNPTHHPTTPQHRPAVLRQTEKITMPHRALHASLSAAQPLRYVVPLNNSQSR